MTGRTLGVLLLAVVVLAGCTPADDPGRCVPPTPSPTGAPWVEADDGEPCALSSDGTWTEHDDGDGDGIHAGVRKAKRTRATSPRGPR